MPANFKTLRNIKTDQKREENANKIFLERFIMISRGAPLEIFFSREINGNTKGDDEIE